MQLLETHPVENAFIPILTWSEKLRVKSNQLLPFQGSSWIKIYYFLTKNWLVKLFERKTTDIDHFVKYREFVNIYRQMAKL